MTSKLERKLADRQQADTSVSTDPALDLDEARSFALRVWSQMSGLLVAGTIYVGDQLGLYRAMAARGPMSAEQLAAATGLHPRWVKEWLRTQGAAGILDHAGEERFELPAVAAEVLANEDSLFYAAGAFRFLPQRAAAFEQLPASFRTGVGHDYDARGPEGAEAVELLFRNWYRTMLVSVIVPGLDGVADKLAAGAVVADVGCGAGLALIEMAKAFPASDFHGYEISQHALARAAENCSEAGVDNVAFHHVAVDHLPTDRRMDLVLTLDCIHDMTHPEAMLTAIRDALDDDGTWLWAEPKSAPTYAENVERNPQAALMYAMSLVSCMSSAMSESGGAGLGTLGISEPKAREMAAEAGFTRFTPRDFGHPLNAYFEVRP
jgi:2-polyprenyl-3-methyl-5-hydroxy-6-metoxy-1,4-benzoquinol methylase